MANERMRQAKEAERQKEIEEEKNRRIRKEETTKR